MDVNQKEYKVVKLSGYGKGGYSYLAEQNDYNRLLQIGIKIPRMLDIDIV